MIKKLIKFIGAALSLSIFFTFSGFAYYDGIGNVYYDSRTKIFQDTYYSEQIGANANGNQHAYFVTSNLENNSLFPIVYNNGIRNAETVGTMVSNLNSAGYNVLVGMNGDIFDTATKAPKGFTMHNGNILSSGYDSEQVIVFDNENRASLQPSSVTFTLKGEISFKYTPPVTENAGLPIENTIAQPEWVRTSITRPIGYVNIPHGAAKALHLFNRNYASSTKTVGNCIEVIIDCQNSDNAQLRVGKTIKGTVKSVNIDVRNTPIGENEIVLSTPSGSDTSGILQTLILGTEVEITTSSNGNTAYDNAKEALGVYYTLLENRNFVTPGKNLNPRTALGIKADGSVVFYVLDGRRESARGLGLTDLARHMQALGCTTVVNLDGGGSSTFYTRFSGKEDFAKLKNTPSGAERKVTNGLFLVYKEKSDNEISNLAVFPEQTLILPKSSVKLQTLGLNSNFEIISKTLRPEYTVSSENGYIDEDGNYTAGEDEGIVRISAFWDNAQGETQVTVVRKGLTITPSIASLKIDPKESKNIQMNVKQGNVNVLSSPKSFNFSCDTNIGTIDSNGKFTAIDKQGEKGNIYISFDSYSFIIPVKVGEDLPSFTDISNHWAEKEIKELVYKGVLSGIGNNLFNPNGKITRAQFAALLAKLSKDDIYKAKEVYFSDMEKNAWYTHYIYWAYEKGIMKGVGDNKMEPDSKITREQMCIMLCNYATAKGIQIPQLKENVIFKDHYKISTWAIDYVNTVAGGAIVRGTSEGNFDPQNSTTRAESAKMIYNFLKIL